jgi:branched-chain amino acid transport system ATP-binding protein
MADVLELDGVSSGYGRLPVLFRVSLSVGAGEMVALIGPNGAGKSTLLKTAMGILHPTAGTVAVCGKRVTHEPPMVRVRRGIAMCPEGRRIFANLSVAENLLSGAASASRDEIKINRQRVVELFPVLGERQRQRAGSLSGGEQQMLAIGRAMMSGPKVLLIDELSLGLAPLVVGHLYERLRQLADEGLSVLVVDERASKMMGSADRTYVMEKGEIVFSGTRGDARLSAAATSALGAGFDRD